MSIIIQWEVHEPEQIYFLSGICTVISFNCQIKIVVLLCGTCEFRSLHAGLHKNNNPEQQAHKAHYG